MNDRNGPPPGDDGDTTFRNTDRFIDNLLLRNQPGTEFNVVMAAQHTDTLFEIMTSHTDDVHPNDMSPGQLARYTEVVGLSGLASAALAIRDQLVEANQIARDDLALRRRELAAFRLQALLALNGAQVRTEATP